MLSLSSTSQKSGDRRAQSLNRVLSILLQGIGCCARYGSEAEMAALHTTMRNLREELEHAETDEARELSASSILKAVEEYNARLEKKRAVRTQELNGVISLLFGLAREVGGADAGSEATLHEIEAEIISTSDTATLATMRSRLDNCLAGMRRQPRTPIPASKPKEPYDAGQSDPVTGLPGPEQAMSDLGDCWSRRDHFYLVIFEADRIETINARYGYAAGDQVLLLLSQHIAQNLGPGDHLFRWRGPFLVALIERAAPESRITAGLQRLAAARLEHAISIRDREVMVPVSITWNMMPLIASRTPEEIAARADQYMTSRMRPVR